MVPRLSSRSDRKDGRGKSFRDLSRYLFEGKQDQPNPERVQWAMSLNSRIAEPSQAWREMAWTAEHSDELKDAAGVRRGGQRNEHPVWHVSLNWHDSEAPTRDEMESAAKSLLKRFGLQDHQALLVAHNDTGHAHLHLMVNLVNPLDGRTPDVSRGGKWRLSDWADEYERQRGHIYCPQREENRAIRKNNVAAYDAARSFAEAAGHDMAPLSVTRDDSPHRDLWSILKRARTAGANDDGIIQIREMHRDAWRQHYEASKTRETERLSNPAGDILSQLTRLEVDFSRQQLATMAANATGNATEFMGLLAKIEGGGELVPVPGMADRYTTKTMMRIEAEMADAGETMAATYSHPISAKGERMRDRATGLGQEQREALKHVTNGGALACVVGYAGTGKSTMLGEARKAWEASGYRVIGAALSGIAAEGLQAGSGIESRTIHGLQWALAHNRETLTAKDVIVIDEAGMVGSRQMHAVLTQARAAGAKVVLVGDPEQLQSIEAGAAFRSLIDRTGAARITTVRRQREAWQQQATTDLADGKIADALSAYDRAGMVRDHHEGTALPSMVSAWAEGYRDRPEASRIMLASTRREVASLNAEARKAMRDAGKLGADVEIGACEESMDAPRRDFRLQLAVGERLLFTKNDRRLEVKNGTLGTLERIGDGRLVVRLDGEKARRVEVDLATYHNLAYGYAVTIHKAQGVTVDEAHVLAGRNMDRHGAYVALSRHRDSVALHVDRDKIKSMPALVNQLTRARHKASTLDYRGERGQARRASEERSQTKLNFRRAFAEAEKGGKSRDLFSNWMRAGRLRDTGRNMRPN